MKLVFKIAGSSAAQSSTVQISQCAVAGWAGRNHSKIQEHIDELAVLGVAPPSTVPLYYLVSINQLTQADHIQVVGEHTSGEAEILYFSIDDEAFISLASDHTDRRLESHSVALSKQVCAKPVATEAWRMSEVQGHWDQMILRSWVEENGAQVLYQEHTLDALLKPDDLSLRHFQAIAPPTGNAMLCGTVPVIGDIRPSKHFSMELYDPMLNRSLRHHYRVQELALVS